jgi:hypothetical protein
VLLPSGDETIYPVPSSTSNVSLLVEALELRATTGLVGAPTARAV